MSSEPSSAAIRVEGLSKCYRLDAHQGSLRQALAARLERARNGGKNPPGPPDLWALQEVSFTLRPGEALGVVGPNGAGKTTLLKILARVTCPTRGTVQVAGRLGALLELGAGFHPDLTGRENVFLYGAILGLRRREIHREFDRIVAFSGLERFIDSPVKRYSSGMYVRLAFSVAAHTSPQVLLVDEALAVGDAAFRQKCIRRIQRLQQCGASVIFISHNLPQVRAVCQRGIFLLAGQVRASGSVNQAIAAYDRWLQEAQPAAGDRPDTLLDGLAGEDLRLAGVETCDLQGRPRALFDPAQGMEIRLHYVAHKRFPSVHFVIRLLRPDGLVCALLRSAELGLPAAGLAGNGYIAIRLAELQLVSGHYLVEARLRDRSDAVTLALGGSAPFQVAGPGQCRAGSGGVFLPRLADVSLVPLRPLPSPASGEKEEGG